MKNTSLKSTLAALSTLAVLSAQAVPYQYHSDLSMSANRTEHTINLDGYSTKKIKELGSFLECKGALPPFNKNTPFVGGFSKLKEHQEKMYTLSQPVTVYGQPVTQFVVSYSYEKLAGDNDTITVFLDNKKLSLQSFAKSNRFKDASGDKSYYRRTLKMPKKSADAFASAAYFDEKWGGIAVECGVFYGT